MIGAIIASCVLLNPNILHKCIALTMNTSDQICKLCECDTEDLMLFVLCDCETIKEFWKFVIILIDVNSNNDRYRYVGNKVLLGFLYNHVKYLGSILHLNF